MKGAERYAFRPFHFKSVISDMSAQGTPRFKTMSRV